MNYKKLNVVSGWLIFIIASSVYLLTMESTASLWDCGEYITAAYKLEVGHPPGAPLFMVLGRLFSFFAQPESVALWINALSAISSSLTILFMFWSCSILLRKMIVTQKGELKDADGIMVILASAIASLAYTFSDSFWFSAVEGEVYAMASLFTAVIFWAALKWDEEMNQEKVNSSAPNRWIIIIFFLLGLAVGVHLLGILVVPAIGYIIYFNVSKEISLKWFVLTGVISVFALGFIQEGIIPGSIALASKFEVSFVNSLGLPFFSGTIFFFIILVGGCVFAIRYAQRNNIAILYNIIMGLVVLLIGYGSFAVIVIRSDSNTPLDENDPENLVTLHSYLKREQYGSNPIFSGPYWNSLRLNESLDENRQPQLNSTEGWEDLSAFYLRRFVVQENDEDIKAFVKEADAINWVKNNKGVYSIQEKYFESNGSIRKEAVPSYSQTTIFPRMYSDDDGYKTQMYKEWSGYDPGEEKGTELGRDGLRLPTMGENLTYFFRYQVDWMYVRYLLWNFSGRQNDIQGHGDNMRGNWISGIDFVDAPNVGPSDAQPYYTSENPAHNRFFLLPLAFIMLGIFYHYYKAPKDAFVLTLAFLFTGLAIVVYLNQKPYEPRERDYAYSGSFYFFTMWLAFGVYALYDMVMSADTKILKNIGVYLGGGLLISAICGYGRLWLVIVIIIAVLYALSYLLNRIKMTPNGSIAMIGFLGFIAPLLMGLQGWDDHNRNGKTSAKDLAYNYLNSCEKNGILFTNGDNDTFPLWYLQEVEGKRTDVRVCNLSLMGTDWYTNQMKLKAYESSPLPINFSEDQILMYAGNTDQIAFHSLADISSSPNHQSVLKTMINLRLKRNQIAANIALDSLIFALNNSRSSFTLTQPSIDSLYQATWTKLTSKNPNNLEQSILDKYTAFSELLNFARSKYIDVSEDAFNKVYKTFLSFEEPWSGVDLSDAMSFVKNEKNMFSIEERAHSFFPSNRFYLPVNKQNAIKSGVLNSEQVTLIKPIVAFEINKNKTYLSRDEIMMLEILANNDWKRGIYFSSIQSEVSKALFNAGHLNQVGMAYELSPIEGSKYYMLENGQNRYSYYMMQSNNTNLDNIRRNLTKVFQYGEMANPSVLTDYYARRHTIAFRLNFLQLAEQFYLQRKYDDASKILDFALNKMPLERVLDQGEVEGHNNLNCNIYNRDYEYFSEKIPALNSGILHEYVQLYLNCNANKKAEKLALPLLDKYESIVNFFEKASVEISSSPENIKDLYAVMGNLFNIRYSNNSSKNKSSAIEKRINLLLNRIYKKTIPRISSNLIKAGNDNGEDVSSGMGIFGERFTSLNIQTTAMGEHYGYLKKKNQAKPSPTSETPQTPLLIGN